MTRSRAADGLDAIPDEDGGKMWFACNVCGIRAPRPILCTKSLCPTEMLMAGSASTKKH